MVYCSSNRKKRNVLLKFNVLTKFEEISQAMLERLTFLGSSTFSLKYKK